MRLVHETPERDIRVREVKRALRKLAAQIMRIAAGAGDVRRMGDALERLNEAMDAMRDQRAILFQEEAAEALRFAEADDFPDYDGYEIERAVDEILRHALRLVASRYQDQRSQVSIAEGDLQTAIQSMDRALRDLREKGRRGDPKPDGSPKPLWSDPRDGTGIAISPQPKLTPRMMEALAFAAIKDRAERVRSKRPHPQSLAALEKRGMVVLGPTNLDYRLTEKGREALSNVRRRRGQVSN